MTATSASAYKLLHNGAVALARVEANGMRVDLEYLEQITRDTDAKIRELRDSLKKDPVYATWRRAFGERTKLGSNEQLTHVLFKVMKLPYPGGATPTGRLQADEAVIGKVKLPFVKDYLRLKKYEKVRSTYIEGIRREVVGEYIHPFFNLNTARTFRSSADSPNFQNIPIRNPEIAAIVRRCFCAREGNHIVEVDYSGIEVRISACYHKDPTLVRYIKDPTTDMHRDTACQLFFLDVPQVNELKKTVRHWAKNQFVFPQFYGSVYFQCAPALWDALKAQPVTVPGTDLTLREHLKQNGIRKLGKCEPGTEPEKGTFEAHVKSVEKDFWENRFKVYTQWKRKRWEEYQRDGYFTMRTGFKVAALHKRNDVLNYPIQGAAFHCLLQSLIWLQRWLDKNRMRTLIVGQIHDSMVLDVPPDEIQTVLTTARRIMTQLLPAKWKWICVPLEVEADVSPVGASWHDKSQWVETDGVWAPKGKG